MKERRIIEGDVVLIAGIFLMFILFAGEPDLMDAIIARLMRE